MSENVTARIPAKKRNGAYTSGTSNEYANIGNEARNNAMAAMAGKIFMVPPILPGSRWERGTLEGMTVLSRIRTAGWGALVAVIEDARVDFTTTDAGIVVTPEGAAADAGLVFYPGARVDPYAYVPIMAEVAAVTGRVVVIPLLGSYCANDLSAAPLTAVSVEGANDGLSTPAQIDAATELLPASVTRVSIPGANHASFGDYGAQSGDGPLEVDRAEVRAAVAEAALLLP